MLHGKGKAEEPSTCQAPPKNLSLTIFRKWSVSAHSCERVFCCVHFTHLEYHAGLDLNLPDSQL